MRILYFFFLLVFPITLWPVVINIYNTSTSHAVNNTVSDSKNLAANDTVAQAIHKDSEVKNDQKQKSDSFLSSWLANYKNYFLYCFIGYYLYELQLIPFSWFFTLFQKSTLYIKKKTSSVISFFKNKLLDATAQEMPDKKNSDQSQDKSEQDVSDATK
jgi:hypothetical protein